jgi:hypothetical protein
VLDTSLFVSLDYDFLGMSGFDSNPESCRSKRTNYQLSHPI